MAGERNLQRLLASLSPELRPGDFVFAAVADAARLQDVVPEATVCEPEGLTVVLTRDDADTLGLTYDFVAGWIILRVHSALDAVGLTAAVSGALASAGVSCNVLAGLHHDHLLVPADRAQDALEALTALARRAADDAD